MVIVTRLGVSRSPRGPRRNRLGLQEVRYAVKCYGAEGPEAARLSTVLYGAVSDAIHNKGPRRDAQGRYIFRTEDEVGGEPDEDPDTHWRYETVVVNVIAAAQAVA